nr:hypothetical protein [Hymenobacter lutimineralis]
MLVGITVHATGCAKKGTPEPAGEKVSKDGKEVPQLPDNCPACGRG